MYEQYESTEEREKAIKDSYQKGRQDERNRRDLSHERWKRFYKSVGIIAAVAITAWLIFGLIIPAIKSNNEWNNSLQLWKIDCLNKGGIIVEPTQGSSGKYICIVGKIDSYK